MTTSSQPDWEQFWRNTRAPLGSVWLGKILWWLFAVSGSRQCLKVLKGAKKINSIIELGGGAGCLASLIAKGLGLGSEALTLIDNSPGAKRTWQEFSGFGKYILDDFLTHDFRGKKFDLVFSVGVVEHWAEEKERLKVIKRHAELSKEYVIIRVPRKGVAGKIFEIYGRMKNEGGFEKNYTSEELKKEISEAGLKALKVNEGLFSTAALAEPN